MSASLDDQRQHSVTLLEAWTSAPKTEETFEPYPLASISSVDRQLLAAPRRGRSAIAPARPAAATRWPMRLRVLGPLLAALVLLSVAPSTGVAAAGRGRVCGTLRASVPYTRHGAADRWRVYIVGRTTCAAAEAALNAVMHDRATLHEGKDEAGTYLTYGTWSCPAGQMGAQICDRPHRTPPYAARAAAVDCSEGAGRCPTARPPSWL